MVLEGKRVVVVGLARSGIAAARLLAAKGATVTANDMRTDLAKETGELAGLGIRVVGGGHPEDLFVSAGLVVVSPGVPAGLAALDAARRAGVKVISEVELAWQFLKGQLIGVTGSNGKTTTTTLIGELLKAAGEDVVVGGNIGSPLTGLVEKTTARSWTVAELSSFQLEGIDQLRAGVAVVTNITPDHLDRHATFEDYVAAKERLFENQTAADWAVLNGCDGTVVRMASGAKSRRLFFSREGRDIGPGIAGVYIGAGAVRSSLFESRDVPVIGLEEIPLPGLHNVENVMAAVAATFCARGPRAEDLPMLREAIRGFKGVEHRIEFVAETKGVRFYNDSKATNVDSTKKALESFERNVILILGGKDKGSDYTQLAPLISERVKQMVLLGAASEKIAAQLEGVAPIVGSHSMEEAVRLSMEAASPGDIVLLAPACASFDMFENYEHRGRVFKAEVKKLAARLERS
jgi:UDP-N-acetylmuramoylalanine--D-glutamate ligase